MGKERKSLSFGRRRRERDAPAKRETAEEVEFEVEWGDESSSSVPTVRASAQPFSMRVKERLRRSVCARAPCSAH